MCKNFQTFTVADEVRRARSIQEARAAASLAKSRVHNHLSQNHRVNRRASEVALATTPAHASMIRPLKFEFRHFAARVRSRPWSAEVDEYHDRLFRLRLACPGVVPSIELSDGSDDESSSRPSEAKEPAWDSPESLQRKLTVELSSQVERPLFAAAMVSTAEKSPREHCVTLAMRDYGATPSSDDDDDPPAGAELLKVTEALDMCGDRGSFTVDVLLQVRVSHAPFYTPHFKLINSMVESFAEGQGEGADFTFEVGGDRVKAHAFVLKLHGDLLRDWCQQGSNAVTAPQGVSKVGLVAFLRTLYGGPLPSTLTSDIKKQVIIAAHWCGVQSVRRAAETCLLNDCLMTDDSVLGWYHFAKLHVCPLLQQQAERYFFYRANAMKESDNASLKEEDPKTILELTAKMSQLLADGGEVVDTDGLRMVVDKLGPDVRGGGGPLGIDELRHEVEELGGDVDGDEGHLRTELRRLRATRKRNRQSQS